MTCLIKKKTLNVCDGTLGTSVILETSVIPRSLGPAEENKIVNAHYHFTAALFQLIERGCVRS